MKKKILFELFLLIAFIFVFPMYINYSLGTNETEERAYKLWGVLKAMGASDEQAAGALGCWEAESGIDETSIEGIYDEPYNIDGPKKQPLQDESKYHEYSSNYVDTYESELNLYRNGYKSNEKYWCGIGIIQSTGPSAETLMNYAENHGGVDWWNFDLQVCYMIDETNGYSGGSGGAKWLKNWIANPTGCSTPEEAALTFCQGYEGINADGGRSSNARKWYDKYKGTIGDTAYAEQILSGRITSGGVTKSSKMKDSIIKFIIGGINLWADAIQVFLDGIIEDSKKDTETMDLVYSKSEIETDEELKEQIQVSDENSYDATNVIKEVDVSNYVDNKKGQKEVVYTQSTKIPVIPADIYSASTNKVNVFDINFYDSSNDNPNEFWKLIKSIVSGFSHVVIYLSAVLILVMLIWRSVLLVFSALGDDPEGARESKEIMDGLLKAICIISGIYVFMALMTYFYQEVLTLILNGNDSNYLIRVNVNGVYSFNTNFIGYLKYMTLKSNVTATFGSSLLYWAGVQANLFWFVFMFLRMFVMAGLTIVAPITAVNSMLNRSPKNGFHIDNILHLKNWTKMYMRWMWVPLIGVIVYKFLVCIG